MSDTFNSRKARKSAEIKRITLYNDYLMRYTALFNNSVIVENELQDVPKRYLLEMLLKKGAVAYDKATGVVLPFVKQGINMYGLPYSYQLIGFNGYVLNRTAEEVIILRSNDKEYPLINTMELKINEIVDYDMSITQNLEAIKTMSIAEVESEKNILTAVNELESRRVGSTIFFKNKSAGLSDLKVQSTNAQYLIDKLLSARQDKIDELLNILGIATSKDKRERLVSQEANTMTAYTKDCGKLLIDTFNYDAELGGLSVRLKSNSAFIMDEEKAYEIEANKGANNNDRI